MKVKWFLFIAAIFSLFCCDNMLDNSTLSNMGGGINNLSISVLASPTTKDLITSTYFPSTSQIGVFVTNASGGDYDGHSYNNILYTASGSDANQTWNGSTIELSMNEGKCYAYYPYNSSVSDATKIPVSTAEQIDYMYATPVTVNANNKNATLSMNHALSVVRFMIKKGSYNGTGLVTAVSVKSNALGTSGYLNAKTGKLTDVSGTGSEISVSKSLTLSDATQDVDVIVVPTEAAADLTLSVTLDGMTYSTMVSSATLTKANCNEYTLTVNQGELALSGIEIGDWGYDDSGAPVITAGSYKVTFAGNYSDISFSNSVSGSTVTIKACGMTNGSRPKEVTASSGTLSQSIDGYIRTITLSNITSNVTVTFNGTVVPIYWKGVTDGVYAISSSYEPVAIENATSNCIGVALINSETGQKLMIEKYEAANSSYGTAASGYFSSERFYWGGYDTDQSITNYTSSTYAKADYNGIVNSEVLKTVTTGGSSHTSYATIGAVLNQFISNSSENQGHSDWYIPACGQLYLICLNMSNINSTLSSIGGTQLSASSYWSSSECNSTCGWIVYLNNGRVDNYCYKYYNCRLRLVRDLF